MLLREKMHVKKETCWESKFFFTNFNAKGESLLCCVEMLSETVVRTLHFFSTSQSKSLN